jgi:hypothetical protein
MVGKHYRFEKGRVHYGGVGTNGMTYRGSHSFDPFAAKRIISVEMKQIQSKEVRTNLQLPVDRNLATLVIIAQTIDDPNPLPSFATSVRKREIDRSIDGLKPAFL